MSAPLVAAECALVASRWPQMSSGDIMARVVSSSDAIDAINPARAGGLGLGRINAWRALTDSVAGVRLTSVDYDEVGGNGDGRVRADESAAAALCHSQRSVAMPATSPAIFPSPTTVRASPCR